MWAQLADGLVALPLDARNKERLEWLADEIIVNGGEASVGWPIRLPRSTNGRSS